MLIYFSQTTHRYQKAILGLIIISMVLVMSQISLHALMLQELTLQKQSTQTQQLSANTTHCEQLSQATPCQSIISISDSLSVNSILAATTTDFISFPFLLSFGEPKLNQLGSYQLSTFNFIIKIFSPSINIKLHSFLI